MPVITQVRNVNFGSSLANATGSLGVGYQLIDAEGTVSVSRITSGVFQLASGSGLYAAEIEFPDTFRGSILWDTGDAFLQTYYATEQYNIEENSPYTEQNFNMLNLISGSIQTLIDYSEGRWIIEGNQMKFYKGDNSTLIATFNLFDNNGIPTSDAVFERVKV